MTSSVTADPGLRAYALYPGCGAFYKWKRGSIVEKITRLTKRDRSHAKNNYISGFNRVLFYSIE